MKFRIVPYMVVSFVILLHVSAYAANDKSGNNPAGFAIDLLPTVISGIQGKSGYSFQVWAGIEKVKIRLVSAHLYQPDSLIDDSFKNYEMNVTAMIFDYFFSENFTGFWIGAGAESWNSTILHKASDTSANWTDNILTAGAGYVWKITENVYLDPFAAVHYRMNDNKVSAGNENFNRKRVSGSASVKIGCMFSL